MLLLIDLILFAQFCIPFVLVNELFTTLDSFGVRSLFVKVIDIGFAGCFGAGLLLSKE